VPWLVRQWTAREGQEKLLLEELLRVHRSEFAASPSVSESLVYRERQLGREFLDLVRWGDDPALMTDDRRDALDWLEQIGAAHGESRPRSHRLQVIQEFSTNPERSLYGIVVVLRARTGHAGELTEGLRAIARDVVDRLSPTRVLVGRAADDPELLFFLGDSTDRIDLARYLRSPLRRHHGAALGPLLGAPARFYSFDPLWRYIRAPAPRTVAAAAPDGVAPPAPERRPWPRYPASWPVRLWPADDVFLFGRAVEVSLHGMRVLLSTLAPAVRLRPGETCRAEVSPWAWPQSAVRSLAVVRHLTDGVGLETTEELPMPTPPGHGVRVLGQARLIITSREDIVTAHHRGRCMAMDAGFTASDPTLIATAISELTRNIVRFASRGAIILRLIERGPKQGLEVVAVDEGPGIPNVELAMQEGYSTSGGLGRGLPGVRQLMDEFEIHSRPGQGTTVTARKWKRS
jgi:serine/threonine-protein kinase RsbT